MRLLVIADDDSVRRQVRDVRADVLVSCGDLADESILAVARACCAGVVLAVKGNHDSSSDFPSPIQDLHLNPRSIAGVRFGGFGGAWRYKPRGNFLYDQEEVSRLLDEAPPVDIFVAHNSPMGTHDREDEVHTGFDGFNTYITRAAPRLFLHGHQHVNAETCIGSTRVVSVYGHRQLEV